MRVEQFKPAHADHISGYDWTNKKGRNSFDEMIANEEVVAQCKRDGERIKMHIENGGVVAMDSRRVSKKTGLFAQCQQNFPEFASLGLDLGYTVLDGELVAVRDDADNWSDIVGVIHSLPDRAASLKATGQFKVKYIVFDCCFYDGADVRAFSYRHRYDLAKKAVEAIGRDDIEIAENFAIKSKEDAYSTRDAAISKGYEGVVLKSLDRSYYDVGAYIKAKKFETKDLVVYDFEYGNGKYSGTVGALKCGYWDGSKVVHVCDLNCGTDKDRDEWLQGMLDGSRKFGVVEVKCQEVTESSLRHPVYVRYRPDKSYNMCAKATVFK